MILQQNTPEWLEMRKQKVGASDAPAIMEVSPWNTAHSLWEEKVNLRPAKQMNDAMKRGHDKEEHARVILEKMLKVSLFPTVLTHPDHPWMIASLDGISLDGVISVEIKCPGRTDHFSALSGDIPTKYYPQLQHQLAVTGHKEMYYFSYLDDHQTALVLVRRDDDYIKDMIAREKEFWDCVMTFTPPALTDKDYVDLSDDKLFDDLSRDYLNVCNQISELERQEKKLKDALLSACDKCNAKGNGLTIQKIVRKGNVDYSCIPELKTINLELYRKAPIESWRIIKR